MPYHRPEWVWYLADIVVESRVEDISDPILTIQSHLIWAESPEAAYADAEELCQRSDDAYRNRFGKVVHQRAVGIHELYDLQTEKFDDDLHLISRVVSCDLRMAGDKLVRLKHELRVFGGERPEFFHLDQ